MFLGDLNVNRGMKLFAAAAVATTGVIAGSAQAARVVGTQAVYYNQNGQSVLADATNYSARDNGDGTFLVNVANILMSDRTQLTGVYFEDGFSSLVDGGPTIAYMTKANPTVVPVSGADFAASSSAPPMDDLIDWTGTAQSVTASGYGSGIDNTLRMTMTFEYADGVTFDDVEALLGGYGYRIATLVENFEGVDFASTSGPLNNPDAGTVVPTPTAFAAGLGLLGLAGLKRRRDEA